MRISIRKFEEKDIPDKVRWVNDPLNNKFLHYDLPLREDRTFQWFRTKNDLNRYDAVIEADGNSVGLVGLLDVDRKNNKAEFYILIGNRDYLGCGVGRQACRLMLEYGFKELGLNRIFLFTEYDNIAAQRLFAKVGFENEGLARDDLYSRGRYVSRYLYGISKEKFLGNQDTPVCEMGELLSNRLYIKRDDLYPFSFGGNKARKAVNFFREIDGGDYGCVVTYGSSSSNHCRIVANMAAARKLSCYIISPEESSKPTFNSKMSDLFGARKTVVPVAQVHEAIENKLEELKDRGLNPYFIPGGGHGNLGTQAYVDCYEEIRRYEKRKHLLFDYIFLASGTGATQAGLVCGQLINCDQRKIVGISIARKNPRGRKVVLDSVADYMRWANLDVDRDKVEEATVFLDDYIAGGYGISNAGIMQTMQEVLSEHGIPLDSIYTGKAFHGMKEFLMRNAIKNKTVMFVHTGGTPLFFDDLTKEKLSSVKDA